MSGPPVLRARRFLTILVSLTICNVGCTRGAASTRRRDDAVRAVKLESVRQEQTPREIEITGTLAAEDQVTVASQADGAVGAVLADLGDRVRNGQALIELDREKLEYNLEGQKAALARALAKYGATDPNHLPDASQTPDVQRTAAELEQARQALNRARELTRRQLLPTQSLEDAQTSERSKQAAFDTAMQNAKNLAADIDASNAMVKLADRQLRDATIRAPFDGFVQKRFVSVGDFVKAQAAVMSIVRVDTLKAIGEIPERMTPWVKVGQPITLSVDAYPGKRIDGSISRISPAVDAATRAFPFEALVRNEEGLLKPGTFTRVHLTTALVEPVLSIPYAAMQYRYGVYRVFTVKADTLVMRELKTGDRVGDRMEVLDGLSAGDRVVITDVDNLAEGMKVSIAEGERANNGPDEAKAGHRPASKNADAPQPGTAGPKGE